MLLLAAKVMALVLALMSRVPMFHPWFVPPALIVIVPVTLPVLSNTAVSCAKGKLFTAGDPPDNVAHAVADQFCAPARFQ